MKEFIFKLELTGTYSYEDPMCPSEWRGSGIYDKDETVECDAVVIVCAENFEQAKDLIYKCDFDDAPFEVEVNRIDWKIESWVCKGDVDDDDEAGVVDVLYDSFLDMSNDEYDYGHNIPKTQTNEYGEEI